VKILFEFRKEPERMASSHSDNQNCQTVSGNLKGKPNTSADEIDLTDYLRVIWRRKYLIVLGTALPSLLVYLGFCFSPSNYRVTYTYDVAGDEKDLNLPLGQFAGPESSDGPTALSGKDELFEKRRQILLDRFYGQENLDSLAGKLQEGGFGGYAQGLSQAKIQLEISDSLLTMTVVGGPREDLTKMASIVRDNFEQVLPMYSVKQELRGNIVKLKTEMAAIEEGKFSVELDLERKRAILAKLKDMAPADSSTIPGGIILQLNNISQSGEYLPVAYQIQAAGANIINLEETIAANQRRYDHYEHLLSLNEKLLDQIKSKTSSYYGINDFRLFLTGLAGEDQGEEELTHYLSAYIKRIENAISTNAPVVEKPRISSVPKGGLKKTGIVFVALLMITTFGAFLLETARKSRGPGS
jgi:hypothetical protein